MGAILLMSVSIQSGQTDVYMHYQVPLARVAAAAHAAALEHPRVRLRILRERVEAIVRPTAAATPDAAQIAEWQSQRDANEQP